jgi:hypothetical protein
LKIKLLIVFIAIALTTKAQKIDSIFVNLYTDSLKKGTYNYINIDGQLSNGRFMPLDSTKISFSSAQAKFVGNSIVIPSNFSEKKVNVKVTLKSNPAIFKEFEVYIKQMEDPPLKSIEEIKPAVIKSKKKKGKK